MSTHLRRRSLYFTQVRRISCILIFSFPNIAANDLANESMTALFNALSRKPNTDYHGKRVGPGWVKYEWSDSIWNLDDGSSFLYYY